MMKKVVKPTKWHKLDNTAHLFPAIASRRSSNVFRITAVLRDAVDAALLQAALVEMLPYFSAFNVRLRHGAFWSYMETNSGTPHVHQEEDAPCRFIDPVENDRFLFRILYYNDRVHLETFHALTDGTGAMRFLKAVCYAYCKLRYPEGFTPEQSAVLYGIENASDIEDAYLKPFGDAQKESYREDSFGYRIRSELLPDNDVQVTTLLLKVTDFKCLCKKNGVSINEYLTAAIAYAIYEECTCSCGSKRPINIFVPVNLRRFFSSETSLNFFTSVMITLPAHTAELTFEEVLRATKEQYAAKVSKDKLKMKLAYTAGSEKNFLLRVAPLPIKNIILHLVYRMSSQGSTLCFSNLGQEKVEPLFEPYMTGLRFLLFPTTRETVKMSACSLGDELAVVFTARREDSALQRNVARRIVGEGVAVTIESNGDKR